MTTRPPTTPILSARGVVKTYRTGSVAVEALRTVDLDIAAGELVTVMGPSGNGKTTLLNCLSGLDDIDAGSVVIDEVDIHRLSDAKRTTHRANRMGFVFQSFNLIPVLTARENVEIPLGVLGVRPTEARERAEEMLGRVGLGSRGDHRPTELSGGEQQRVAIARALVTEPALVWADEPTGNLDSETAESIVELLLEVNQAGQTVVIVTHDQELGGLGHRLVEVRDGRIVHDAAPVSTPAEPEPVVAGVGAVMIVLVALATFLLGVALHDLVRRPVLRRVALRNLTRRRGEASLVVLGSALGTAIIAGAFVVGDTFDNSIRDIARTDLGPIDQIVDVTDLDQLDATFAAVEGTIPVDGVDGVASVVSTQAALATTDAENPLAEPSVSITEGDFDDLRALGAGSSGLAGAGATPVGDELVIVDDVADELELTEGDTVTLHAYGAETPLTVRTIVPHIGIAGRGEAFVAPGTLVGLSSRGPPEGAPPVGEVWVSLDGDVFDSTEAVSSASSGIDERLRDAGLAFEQRSAKRSLLDEAEAEGEELTSIFTAIGGFSVLAGVLLLVNLFVMLAEERKVSLGVLRAVGWKRGHLVRGFVLEGAAYAAIAAGIGAAMGVGVGWVLIRVTSALFASTGTDLTLRLAIEPSSLLAASLVGLVISLVVVWLTSWRISRLGIIRALRDLPEPASQRRTAVAAALGAFGVAAGLALSFGPGALGSPELLLLGVPMALLSLLAVLNRFLSTRWANIGIGLGVIAWSVAAFGLFSDVLTDPPISAFLLQGVLMVTGAVAIASTMGPAWARLASRFGADDPATKLGLAYPVARRFRTGVSLAMFSLIVFSLTFMAVLNQSFGEQTDAFVADASAGYDAIVDSNPADPVSIAELEGERSVSSAVEVSWGIVPFSTDLVPDSLEEPERWTVTGIDETFTSLDAAPILLDRADGYATDVAAFHAVAASDDLVVVSQWFLEDEQVRKPAPGDVVALVLEDGTERELRIVGVAENDLTFAGAFVSRDVVDAGLADTTWPRHYVSLEGDAEAAATALDGRFVENGVEANTFRSIVGDQVRLQQGFFDLLSGYLALGLVIGVAGLGVVMVRAVRERRAQVGMLRSMGLPAPSVGRWFVTEAGFVALQGIAAGVVLGLVSSYQLLTRTNTFEIDLDFALPASALTAIVLVPLIAAGLAAAVPAVRAARLRPSEALRLTS